MDDKNMVAFIGWLPTKIKELEGKSPEEVVGVVNQLAESEEGIGMLTQLIEQFKTESSKPMLRKGGLLGYMPDGGPGQVVAARDLPHKKKPKNGGFVDVGKMQGGGEISRNNPMVDSQAAYKRPLQSLWNAAAGAPRTSLPARPGTTGGRTIRRAFSDKGQIDMISDGTGNTTVREIGPTFDTTFTRIKGRWTMPKIKAGTPAYKENQGFGKEYGVYRTGGTIKNEK